MHPLRTSRCLVSKDTGAQDMWSFERRASSAARLLTASDVSATGQERSYSA